MTSQMLQLPEAELLLDRESGGRNAVSVRQREIPYDYVATFTLEGRVGNRVQDVINVSVEGAFVAVAIGYSVLPFRREPAAAIPAGTPVSRARLRVDEWARTGVQAVQEAIKGGVPALLMRWLAGIPAGGAVQPARPLVSPADLEALLECFRHRCRVIDFLYSIVDSGSGRELQNQPIHNIAGLGSADGVRPFRPLAKPMLFMPRSTIRIEIIEQTPSEYYEGAQLYFVLHGYKMLGYGITSP